MLVLRFSLVQSWRTLGRDDSKADVIIMDRRESGVETIGGAAEPAVGVPIAPARHSEGACGRTLRIRYRSGGIGSIIVPAPLGHIPGHVEKPEGICLVTADVRSGAEKNPAGVVALAQGRV